MAKESLSSDIDLIKEFEQVKLKQKLLINSISQKNITFQNQTLDEINKKLDFLVNIFQKADESEQDDHIEKKIIELSETVNTSFSQLTEKITNVEENYTNLNEKIENLTQLFLKQKEETNTKSIINKEVQEQNNIVPTTSNVPKQSNLDVIKKQISQDSPSPPPPNFKVDTENKSVKKKKWF